MPQTGTKLKAMMMSIEWVSDWEYCWWRDLPITARNTRQKGKEKHELEAVFKYHALNDLW